jgi:lipopolysaccharide transport system permease protein
MVAIRGFVPIGFAELWGHRELVWFLLSRELKGRYRQMALGPLWLVIGPLINTVLFTFLFGYVAKVKTDGIPYPLFSYSALVVWSLFGGVVQSTARSLVDSRDLIAKVYFPRLIIPIVGIVSALVNLLPSLLILAGMMLCMGYGVGWSVLMLPLFFVLAILLGLGVGLWWAPWIVHYRDLGNVLDYISKGWMYLSPVVYSVSLVPERWRGLYRLNPMVQVIDGTRWALFGTTRPDWHLWVGGVILAVVLTIAGAYQFRRAERTIVDIV